MNQLLIPSTHIELTMAVQQCLLAAQQQGLDISNIELGVSPTHQFLIQLEDKAMALTLVDGQCRHAAMSELVSSTQHWSINYTAEAELGVDNHIAIDILKQHQRFDIWRVGAKTHALECPQQGGINLDTSRHLSWLLACLALEFPLEDSLVIARAGCQGDVSRETWPSDACHFPSPVLQHPQLGIELGWDNRSPVSFPTMKPTSLGLYPVVDDVTWIARLLELGIKTIQLRIKDPSQPDLKKQIVQAIELGRQYQAQVFINDYWQLAIEYGAFGVHLGQEDLEFADLKALSDAGIRLGLSTHGYYEIKRIAQLKPSYIALGHIFPTTTKVMPSKPQGIVRLKLYQGLISEFPTVAIGGINLARAEQVWQTGVSSLAVVRAITLSDDPQRVISQFESVMRRHGDDQ